MDAVLEIEATVTERGQTTVPSPIRRMLGLGKRGAVIFRGMADGTVQVVPKDAVHEDPALDRFLALLERDIVERPQALTPLSQALLDRTDALVGGLEVDLDGPLKDG